MEDFIIAGDPRGVERLGQRLSLPAEAPNSRKKEILQKALETNLESFELLLEMRSPAGDGLAGEGESPSWVQELKNSIRIYQILAAEWPAGRGQTRWAHRMFLPPIHREQTQALEGLLRAGLEIDSPNLFGETPLMVAVQNGSHALVRWLIRHGADPNARGIYGTVLMKAVESQDREMVRLLIQHGAAVNASGIFGSALRTAIHLNDPDLVRLLLKHGARVSPEPLFGVTLVEEADRNGQPDLTRLLKQNQIATPGHPF